MNQDPTRQDLLAFIRKTNNELSLEAGEFEIEEVGYWIAANYHGGQTSNLYSALCLSPFSPGPLNNGINEDNYAGTMLYETTENWIETE